MGLVINHYRVSLASTMVGNHEDYIQDQINRLLAVMPKGAKHIQTVQEGISDLSVPYKIIMEHPRFADGTKIELDYVRDFYQKPDGGIEQFITMLGIRYVGPDGKDIYKRD